MNNALYIRRRNKILLAEGAGDVAPNYVGTILKNIENLGYTFSESLIRRLENFSLEQLTAFYQDLVKSLREILGEYRDYTPMYPNFPQQVMEMDEWELYLNAIIHYLTGKLPGYEKKERLPLLDKVDLKIIAPGTLTEFEGIFTNLAGSKTSLSEQDKHDLKWFIESYKDDVYQLLPPDIPSKENLAYIGGLLVENTEGAQDFLKKYIKTATDLLRLAAAMSGGDVSLATNARFIAFKRPARRALLELLETSGSIQNITEDMLRWKKRWVRLGERLHPGEFSKRFPKSFEAFEIIRNDKPFETFNGKIEKALLEKDAGRAIELLDTRAGDFARRLDNLLRLDERQQQDILEKFRMRAPKISTPVLLQVMTHFEHRNAGEELRVFFPKGDVAKVKAIKNNLPALPEEICGKAMGICNAALIERFSKLAPLGKCYLDEKLKNFLVPFSQRSASKALRTLVRGSRIELPAANVIRFFLWWKNGSARTDIDLSAALYDANFNYKDIVSYYNLRNYGGHHSGDIVDAPEGAAEYIDIDIAKTVEMKIRYVVMAINSYTRQPYCDLPECFAGWMARTHPGSGEIFEPRTLQNKIDVASNTRICLPMVIDLIKMEAVWTDIALKESPMWNNVRQNLRGVSLMARALTNLTKTNLYDLFSLHIAARGELTDSIENADTVFSVEKGITPFELDIIAAQFM